MQAIDGAAMAMAMAAAVFREDVDYDVDYASNRKMLRSAIFFKKDVGCGPSTSRSADQSASSRRGSYLLREPARPNPILYQNRSAGSFYLCADDTSIIIISMAGGTQSSSKPSKKGDIRSHFIRKRAPAAQGEETEQQQQQQLREVDPKDVLRILQENARGWGRAYGNQPESISWDDVRYIIKPEVMLHLKQNKKFVESNPDIFRLIIRNDSPLDVVKAYARAFPTLLVTENSAGTAITNSALGRACNSHLYTVRNPSLELIRYLIKEMIWCRKLSPHKNLFRDLENRPGGFFSFTGFPHQTSLEVTRVLLEEYPNGALLSEGYSNRIFPFEFTRYASPERTKDYIEKLTLLLMAASMGTVDETQLAAEKKKFLMPHSFLDCVTWSGRYARSEVKEFDYFLYFEKNIVQTIEYMKVVSPGEFLEANDDGNLPLHIVLSNKKFIRNLSDSGPGNTKHSAKLVKFLLEIHPESITIRDGKGRLPIHLALEHCAPFYKLILDKSPDWVLESKCPVTKLYPFQIATVAVKRIIRNSTAKYRVEHLENYSTQVAFDVLRRAPVMAALGLNATAKRDSWFDSDLFSRLQRKKMEKQQIEIEITALERQLEDLKKNKEIGPKESSTLAMDAVEKDERGDQTSGNKRKRGDSGLVEAGDAENEESSS